MASFFARTRRLDDPDDGTKLLGCQVAAARRQHQRLGGPVIWARWHRLGIGRSEASDVPVPRYADTSTDRTPLARTLPRVMGSPGEDRGRLVMPATIAVGGVVG